MNINPIDDHCLCGSGKTYINCCLLDCRRPSLPDERTFFAHQRCYARRLCDCSKSISREHYLTEGVIRLISNPLTVGGLPWIESGTRTLSTDSLAAKILCQRHNERLSEIDQVGIRLFRALALEHDKLPKGQTLPPPLSVFRGDMIELWMLKMLCGLVASGNAADKSTGERINVNLPAKWLHILFGYAPMPTRWGLYLKADVGSVVQIASPIQLSVIYTSGRLNGLILFLHQLGFALVMNNPPSNTAGNLFERSCYRPGQLILQKGSSQRVVRLFWEHPPSDERSITVEQSSQEVP